jgi:uncharacterized membrane protein (UPF0127 family)
MVLIELKNVKNIYGIIGLMGKTKINGYYKFPLSSFDKTLHTFFCFTNMDAICLNKYGRVIQKIEMTPWKYYLCHKDTMDVIEGAEGSFNKIKIGDFIS